MEKRKQIVLVLLEDGQYIDEKTGLKYQDSEKGLKVIKSISIEEKLKETFIQAQIQKLIHNVAVEINPSAIMLQTQAQTLASKMNSLLQFGSIRSDKLQGAVDRVLEASKDIHNQGRMGNAEADLLEEKLKTWTPTDEMSEEIAQKVREAKEIEIEYHRAKGVLPKRIWKLLLPSKSLVRMAYHINKDLDDDGIRKLISDVDKYVKILDPIFDDYHKRKLSDEIQA